MLSPTLDEATSQLKFRDPVRARELTRLIESLCRQIGRQPIALMHVCGSHEQAIAKFGLRACFPPQLNVIMGPGCPVCITDVPEVDEAVALTRQGIAVATYGDMFRVPGTVLSLADAQAEGGEVHVVYGVDAAVQLARKLDRELVFFATGFETTAVATAAVMLQQDLPANFSVLSAHKYVPPAMDAVAQMPESVLEGFLAAGHAATITGWGIFESFVEKYQLPVVVAGFEPLDILSGLAKLLELIRDGRREVVNMYPRCVTREGNLRAQEQLWKVFEATGGKWRGIAHIPAGNLRLKPEWAHLDARRRFHIDRSSLWQQTPADLTLQCRCGDIMTGLASPQDCDLFGQECRPESPVGACMVSSEGTCKIWFQYGGHPNLATTL